MKFTLKGPFKENLYSLMRKSGYSFSRKDPDETEFIFSRPARGYPRFHIYLKFNKEDLILNLHLDQKKPIYKGATAHGGEYEGKLVEGEVERIKDEIKSK